MQHRWKEIMITETCPTSWGRLLIPPVQCTSTFVVQNMCTAAVMITVMIYRPRYLWYNIDEYSNGWTGHRSNFLSPNKYVASLEWTGQLRPPRPARHQKVDSLPPPYMEQAHLFYKTVVRTAAVMMTVMIYQIWHKIGEDADGWSSHRSD